MDSKQFARLVPMLQAQIEAAIHQTVQHAAELIAEQAKSMIGHEQAEWPPLADSTIARKKAAGYEVPAPLLREGELRESIETRVTMRSASIGSDNPEAVVHEHGDSHVPPRPFLASAALKKAPEIVEELEQHIRMVFETGARNA